MTKAGNSDPGTSGVLTQFGKIDGLYFNNKKEPDDFVFEFNKDLSKVMKDNDFTYIEIEVDNKEDYYKLLNDLSKFNNECIKISGVSKKEFKVIIENDIDKNIEEEDEDNNEDI